MPKTWLLSQVALSTIALSRLREPSLDSLDRVIHSSRLILFDSIHSLDRLIRLIHTQDVDVDDGKIPKDGPLYHFREFPHVVKVTRTAPQKTCIALAVHSLFIVSVSLTGGGRLHVQLDAASSSIACQVINK